MRGKRGKPLPTFWETDNNAEVKRVRAGSADFDL